MIHMHETEKLIQEIRTQLQALRGLLNYLESEERWSEEDLGYCRSRLRRIARELIEIGRGRLAGFPIETAGVA
jgi:hypothetical protein